LIAIPLTTLVQVIQHLDLPAELVAEIDNATCRGAAVGKPGRDTATEAATGSNPKVHSTIQPSCLHACYTATTMVAHTGTVPAVAAAALLVFQIML
jgi:hypothetical protein